jgi:hypothetical protein
MSNWNVNFKDIKTEAPHIESIGATLEWAIVGVAGLLSIALFVASANASKNGDGITAVCCGVGAVLVAISPYVAKTFIN